MPNLAAAIWGTATAHALDRGHALAPSVAGALAGGHANTVRIDSADAAHHVDTGCIVVNDRNYPNFELS